MQVKTKYKQTELGLIPDDWEFKKIAELIEDGSILGHLDGNHGELYPRSHEFKEYGIPYIGATDFHNGSVDFSECKHLSLERAKQFKKGIAKCGDVLFAHNATVGPVALLITQLEFVILSTTATYFRCNHLKVDNIFLKYALQSQVFVTQYRAVMAQSTRFQVPITAQRKLALTLPTLPEQRAIATALSDVDALITSLDRLIAKKQDIKQATMQQLFTGKTRLPGFKKKDGFKQTEIGLIPEDWEVKTLKDLHFDISDGNYSSKYPKASDFVSFGVPFIRANNIKNLRITDEDMRCISLSQHGELLKGHLKENDVLITTRGDIGNVAIVPCTHIGSNINAQIVRINTTDQKVNHLYFAFYLSCSKTQEWIRGAQSGSALKQLPVGRLVRMPVILPLVAEQHAIATVLSDMDTELSTLEQRRNKTNLLKQGMMQELLTGRTRLV
ncbi:MAG: restriction endonuclease subunit S [Candidatus Obscuribacterales bacterium]